MLKKNKPIKFYSIKIFFTDVSNIMGRYLKKIRNYKSNSVKVLEYFSNFARCLRAMITNK